MRLVGRVPGQARGGEHLGLKGAQGAAPMFPPEAALCFPRVLVCRVDITKLLALRPVLGHIKCLQECGYHFSACCGTPRILTLVMRDGPVLGFR